jgi:methionyl-tRNA formyltransferase
MRVLFLGNNRVGLEVLRWLKYTGTEIAGVGLHPVGKRKFGEELAATAGLSEDDILPGDRLRDPEVLERVRSLNPDMIVSVLFNYILKPELISIPKRGCINLHPSLLPWNRGQYPNVWSIIEGTPSGVTLHYVDEGVDTGDIIAQQEVEVEPVDTGETLHHKLEEVSIKLFKASWPQVEGDQAVRQPQLKDSGTHHRTRDVDAIDEIDLQEKVRAGALINLLRARTFPPYRGAYFVHDGRRVYVNVSLEYEENL